MENSNAINLFGPRLQPYPISRENGRVADAEKPPQANPASETAQLDQTELREVERLQRRDREVKAHEAAHKANAGQYARAGASFDYQQGPDGKRYAVGGEVSIDIGKEADPRETLEKARTIRRAALAPADPSGQDRQIAMQATRMATEARQELLDERMKKVVTAAQESSAQAQPAPTTTPTGRRALDAIKSVESASLAVRKDPFDRFI